MDPDWIEHRRSDDRERVGWMKPVDDGFVAFDLLGRPRTDVVDWLRAEEVLDALGIGYLADPYELRLESGDWLRVRIAEVSPAGIRVKKDDWGDMSAPQIYYAVPFPVHEDLLRSLSRPNGR
tara:strand:+ start:154 stop:519 length:366 start_codon:yes stop_codon:yes gene_type:complete